MIEFTRAAKQYAFASYYRKKEEIKMGGDEFISRFIFQHYYDLFDDSDAYEGIYICERCGFKRTWYQEGAPYDEFILCEKKRCGGTMRLCVFTKNKAKEILAQE